MACMNTGCVELNVLLICNCLLSKLVNWA